MFDSKFCGRALLRLGLLLLAGLSYSNQALAQPTLTTIQDTVYLADGRAFNGLVLIDWRSFDTANGTVIGQSSKVVQILNGFLRVQLAPTTVNNTTYYSVKFVSRGVVLFSEVWSVPVSSALLRLRDVRAALLPGGFVSGPAIPGNGNPPPIIGNIVGTGTFVDNEILTVPSGGGTAVFTLAQAPNPANTLLLYRNGLLQSEVVDYTISGRNVTFLSGSIPQVGDVLRASYKTGSIGNSAHNLLSADHADTFSESIQRGDLFTAQTTVSPGVFQWRRLPLVANRCLVSNTTDVAWNSCLLATMLPGRVPYSNGSLLTESASSLFWSNATRRFGVGTDSPSTTLHVQDSLAGGVTGLTVQAGSSQGTTPLSTWTGLTVPPVAPFTTTLSTTARIESDGSLTVPRVSAASTRDRAAWRDPGAAPNEPADPRLLFSGDFWYNPAQRARKTFESGQIHPLSQIICSSTGPSTTATVLTTSANCLVPGFFFDAGDRLEIALNAEHTGTANDFSLEMRIGAITNSSPQVITYTTFWSRNAIDRNAALVATRGSGALHGGGISWGVSSIASIGGTVDSVFNTSTVFTQSFVIEFRLILNGVSGTADRLLLRNFSLIRYPAQSNPLP